MLKRLKMKIVSAVKAALCHRAMHGYLALAYGSGCVGVDKQVVAVAVTAVYAVMTVKG